MKNVKLSILSWAMAALIISGCSNNEETPRGEFATGVFIVNEGNFSESNGSVGFYNESTAAISDDIFNQANGVSPGGIIQSVYFNKNLAFIIDQAGNRIEVVESETFKSIATIEQGLINPRYMVVANGKGYVSNWGNYDANYNLPESYVAVIDLDSYSVSKEIKTDNGSEGLVIFGGNVYVANSNSNTVEMINTTNDTVIGTISVATGPRGFVEDKNGKIWVLSSELFANSALSQLDLSFEQVLKSFIIGSSAKSLNINGAGDQLYYLSAPYGADAEVKTVSIDATEDATVALIVGANLYGLGVDPITGIIYLGNHNGFQGNGTVIRYDGETMLDNFAAGIAPNGFVFRK
jgi:YVTN family beta-propeller protein